MNMLFTKRALRGSLDRGLSSFVTLNSTRASDCDSVRFTGSRAILVRHAKFDESVRLRFYALHWIGGDVLEELGHSYFPVTWLSVLRPYSMSINSSFVSSDRR